MGMVDVVVAGQRMDENAVLAAIEHEPGHETRKILDGEGDLVHADRVRSDWPVMPISELCPRELRRDAPTNHGSVLARCRIVVEMGVVTSDRRWIELAISHPAMLAGRRARRR